MSLENHRKKTCARCGTTFYPNHMSTKYCTDDCRSAVVHAKSQQYYREHKPELARAWGVSDCYRAMESGDKKAARRAVSKLVASGTIEKPKRCGRCGEVPQDPSSLQAHHLDYFRPLHVEWICRSCHCAETKRGAACGRPSRN